MSQEAAAKIRALIDENEPVFEKEQIAEFQVNYYGSDDSGGIEDIDVYGFNPDGTQRLIDVSELDSTVSKKTIRDFLRKIEDPCYSIIQNDNAGFEINEGGGGHIRINAATKKIVHESYFYSRQTENNEDVEY